MAAPPPYDPAQPGYPPQQDYKGMPPQQVAPGYPPPGQPMMQSSAAGTTTTTVVMQPATTVVHQFAAFGPYPANITCPNCRATVVTSVSYSDGLMVWLVAGGLCLVGLWLGCCLIPFCMNDLKDVSHACPSCGSIVGHYKRI